MRETMRASAGSELPEMNRGGAGGAIPKIEGCVPEEERKDKRSLGNRYEKIAADYLRKQGFTILESNYTIRGGEIDLIAREGGYLVFIEVKYRKAGDFGLPEEAVDYKKQQRIIRAASHYLIRHHIPQDVFCRFDVVAVEGAEIRLIRNAFSAG